MSIKVYNSSELSLTIRDHYLLTATPKSGYDGPLRFIIPATDVKKISVDDFVKNAVKKRKPQEIHVRSGRETLLFWEHEEFVSNEGKEVILEMGGDGVLRPRFVARGGIAALRKGEKTKAHWIWDIFSFRSAGANVEAPVAEAGMVSAGTLEAGIPVASATELC